MIAIIDYGAGNMQSVVKALEYVGCSTLITDKSAEILAADAAVLPGVGAFGDAMQNLRGKGLDKTIDGFIHTKKPFLGICLGMQVLFESSEETAGVLGLGILKGKIRKIPGGENLKIPHIGWNSLDLKKEDGLFQGLAVNPYVYFVHSYCLKAEEHVVSATTQYGITIDAAVQKDNLYACQFHPEKSGDIGIAMLKNFKRICEE